jgi:hypothetical protein
MSETKASLPIRAAESQPAAQLAAMPARKPIPTDTRTPEFREFQTETLTAENLPTGPDRNSEENQTQGQAQGQTWIVLTTWEMTSAVAGRNAISAANPDTSPDAARETAVAAQPAGIAPQPARQAVSRITVTRLIFRVLPAHSPSGQPTAMPTRNGWLVLQL